MKKHEEKNEDINLKPKNKAQTLTKSKRDRKSRRKRRIKKRERKIRKKINNIKRKIKTLVSNSNIETKF